MPQAQTARTIQIILVVEDEPALVDVIVYNLRQAGFETVEAADGREALRLAAEVRPALVILDLMLPELDGMTVYRILRERSPTLPIIMATARSGETDRVLGLELGADDYVSKPFSPRELVARVRAVLRRAAAGEGHRGARIDLGHGLVVDRRARQVLRHGKSVALTPTEFRLLDLLVDHCGETLSRRQLFDLAWGEDAYGEERAVDVHVRHLREKLEMQPSRPELILTIRGFGYRLDRPARTEDESS